MPKNTIWLKILAELTLKKKYKEDIIEKTNKDSGFIVQTSSFKNIKKSKLFVISLLKNNFLNELSYLTHNIEKSGSYFITISNPLNKNNADKACKILKSIKLDCIVKRV